MKARSALCVLLPLAVLLMPRPAVESFRAPAIATAAEERDLLASSQGDTVLVTVATDGTQANDMSRRASVSADGRYVVFESEASNLVPSDTNGCTDVFIRDLELSTTTRVSVASDGTEANGASSHPKIAAKGRYVTFQSEASNLVAGDTNDSTDVFVADLMAWAVIRVSVASDGAEGNGDSVHPSISESGWSVAFESVASNLVAGDDNGVSDVFRQDWRVGETIRVSVAADGSQGNGASGWPSLSTKGRRVAFESEADNLVPDDTNGTSDIFVYDERIPETRRVSVASGGTQGDGPSRHPTISAEPWYVAFESEATNLVAVDGNDSSDVFVHRMMTAETVRVSVSSGGQEANGGSWRPSISEGGRWVAFDSASDSLVDGDSNDQWDVFVHDMQSGETRRISVSSDGWQSEGSSVGPASSSTGRYVAFESGACNLVPDDTNGCTDIFVRDQAGGVHRVWLPSVLRKP